MTREREDKVHKTVGLCAICRHARQIESDRGSVFYRCGLSDSDPRFVKYPPLPMHSCPGFEGPAESDPEEPR